MKRFGIALFFVVLATANAQEFFDRLDRALTFSTPDNNVRARLSGTLDLETYTFDLPPPGLIIADDNFLFNPRLTLFLDAQVGGAVYAFVQTRVDRGFDPTDHGAQIRLDEYALRITPWRDGRVTLQLGKFATVISRWVQRHLSWDNPFITAPLAYEYVTAISDVEVPYGTYTFGRRLSEKYEYNPIIWGPSYASGASLAGHIEQFDYAFEVKNAALTSRPESWNLTEVGIDHPTFSGRVGVRPSEMWNFGVSFSRGPYLRSETEPALYGMNRFDFHQTMIGQDVSFEWHHLQIWAEVYEARFEVPYIGDADTVSYFIEAKYKFAPQWFAALRWNQQFFGDVPDGYGGMHAWGPTVSRIEGAIAYRFTENMQLKVQYNFQHESREPREGEHLFATQFTVRF
ncbi:MAG: hypothetical protein ACJ8LI_06935 [Chthoniobacterales bacterium]